MERELLRIDNLGAWYKREKNVLSGFSLELREHEAVGLIGLNGAGKTTLLKILSGLHRKFLRRCCPDAWPSGEIPGQRL